MNRLGLAESPDDGYRLAMKPEIKIPLFLSRQDYPKLSQSYYSLLEVLTQDHMNFIASLEPHVIMYILSSISEGLTALGKKFCSLGCAWGLVWKGGTAWVKTYLMNGWRSFTAVKAGTFEIVNMSVRKSLTCAELGGSCKVLKGRREMVMFPWVPARVPLPQGITGSAPRSPPFLVSQTPWCARAAAPVWTTSSPISSSNCRAAPRRGPPL